MPATTLAGVIAAFEYLHPIEEGLLPDGWQESVFQATATALKRIAVS